MELFIPLILVDFQISRLIYTNSAFAILALAANAVHKLWKWPRNERHPTGKVGGLFHIFKIFSKYFLLAAHINFSFLGKC